MTPMAPPPSSGLSSPGFGSNTSLDPLPPMGGTPMSPTLRAEPYDGRSNKTLVGALIALVVILSAAVAVLAVELKHSAVLASSVPCTGPAVAGSSLDAPAGAGEAHLPSAASLAPTPDTTAATTPADTSGTAGTTEPAAPADVVAYLKFLKDIDDRRVVLQNTPTAVPDPAHPTTAGSPTPADVAAQWQALITAFRSQSPPVSCELLAASYLTFLNDSEMSASQPAQAATAASALTAEATKVDAELDKVCHTTHADKLFTVGYQAPAQTPTPPAGQ